MLYGWFYRSLMKLAHRYDWHHAKVFGPFEDGRYQRWCQWCGLRESYSYDPRQRAKLGAILEDRKPLADFMDDCGSPKLNEE
jgi:hypothetical protein